MVVTVFTAPTKIGVELLLAMSALRWTPLVRVNDPKAVGVPVTRTLPLVMPEGCATPTTDTERPLPRVEVAVVNLLEIEVRERLVVSNADFMPDPFASSVRRRGFSLGTSTSAVLYL